MIGLLASIVDGLLVGSVYGLAAMGISLIWGVMDVINLTHGAMIVAGMFGLYLLVNDAGFPVYATLPPVLVAGLLVGIALYWIAVHRMVGRPPLMSLLSTFSVNLVLIGLGTAKWGTVLFNVQVSLPGLSLGRYTFPGTHIMAAVLTAVIAGVLYLFLFHTRPGKAVRAVSGNREAAELVGIPTTRVLALAFGLGVALAGVSGMLIGTLFPFTVLSGDAYQLKSFVVTVLGGLGNPTGALIGGLALGLFEGLSTPFMPVSWTLVFEFVLFVVVLIAFPAGSSICAGVGARDERAHDSAPPLLLDRGTRHSALCGSTHDRQQRRAARKPVLAAIYITLASNLNLMLGYAGYVNFGSIVFFGSAAVSRFRQRARLGLAPAALAGGAAVSALALIFGLGVLRLRAPTSRSRPSGSTRR